MHKQLKILLHGMEHRTVKSMASFLQGPCHGLAQIVEANGDIDAFDLDILSSKNLFQTQEKAGFNKPTIVMSVFDMAPEGVIYLKKPFDVEGMVTAIKAAEKKAVKPSKITIERGITAIPKVSLREDLNPKASHPVPSFDRAADDFSSDAGEKLQEMADWFDNQILNT